MRQHSIKIVLLLVFCAALTGVRVQAHATLVRSIPAANEVIFTSPPRIRLWFSEPLEPQFSKVTLQDSTGKTLDTLPSQVDPPDSLQMYLVPGHLPNGLYTVSWQAVSAADGHRTTGNFAFSLGPVSGTPAAVAAAATPEPIPWTSALIRTLNLLSLALAIGTLGFWLFVWNPSVKEPQPTVERRMTRLIWAGWIFLGLMGLVSLLLEVSTAADIPLLQAVTDPALIQVLTLTQYGGLWLTRMLLWIGLGAALHFDSRSTFPLRWLALAAGAGILLTQSLYSHASGAHDPLASVLSDWLHLTATVLWVGGLAQFFNVILPVKRSMGMPAVGTLVGYFSNFARIAVVSLIVTGFYAAWLQIGSLDALLSTQYGQALLVKGLLILPLLVIAAINLLITHRRLLTGDTVWAGRLRGLVGAELALTAGVLLAVGVMTAIQPGRSALAQQVPAGPTPTPFSQTQTADDLHIKLTFTPGWVGQNTFTVTLSDQQGKPVTNASLIRLRFDNQTQPLGQSELRLQNQGDGTYIAGGVNLSTPGNWRIRTNIQRPDKYDTVLDFSPQVAAAPPAPAVIDVNAPLPYRLPVFLLAAILAVGIGGFVIARERRRLLNGSGFLATGLVIVGLAFFASALLAASGSTATLTLGTPSRILWGVLIAAVGGVLLYWTPRLRRIEQMAGIGAVVAGIIFLALGIGAASTAFELSASTVTRNPVPADSTSLARGQKVYEANCVPCHGPTGRGDGPLAAGLTPPPADFKVHMGAGHSDAQLFDWLTNGIQDTAMPAWGSRLSEQERWDVLNYIRTFAQ